MTESRYTPELAGAILERVSNGESVRQVCRAIGIPESSFRQWVRDDRDGLALRYAQARTMQVDCWADEILTVAYDPNFDPADKRVITENLRWLLARLAPARFGDKIQVGGDPANPIVHLHKQVSVSDLNDEQIDALMVFCDRMLLEHEPASTGEDRRDSDNGGALALLEPPR